MVAMPSSGGVHFGFLAFSLASDWMGESSMQARVPGPGGWGQAKLVLRLASWRPRVSSGSAVLANGEQPALSN